MFDHDSSRSSRKRPTVLLLCRDLVGQLLQVFSGQEAGSRRIKQGSDGGADAIVGIRI